MTIGTSWGLGPVERRTATDQVLHELRAAILAGRIKPEQPLRETVLADAFGTGRSAIREALRHLVQEGLVISEPNKGAQVRAISREDVVDVYRVREAIEVVAVQQAIERQDRLETRPLRTAQERIVAASPVSGLHPPTAELIAADLDFHRAMVALAGSPRLSRAHEPLAAESQMLLNWHPVYSGADYAGDHQVLLEAIESRDPNAAQLTRAHLRLTASLIVEEAARYADRLASAEQLMQESGASTHEEEPIDRV